MGALAPIGAAVHLSNTGCVHWRIYTSVGIRPSLLQQLGQASLSQLAQDELNR